MTGSTCGGLPLPRLSRLHARSYQVRRWLTFACVLPDRGKKGESRFLRLFAEYIRAKGGAETRSKSAIEETRKAM